MDVEQFRRAINQGLGRAILHLRGNDWRPHADAIEHVCLHNTAYDPQCEGSRARYVYETVQLTNDPQHFATLIIEGLLKSEEHWDTCHLFDLAGILVKGGDLRALAAMEARFRRNHGPEWELGAEAIVEANGVKGMVFVANQLGRLLKIDADYSVDDSLFEQAEAKLGKEAICAAGEAAEANPLVRRYIEAVRTYTHRARTGRRSEVGSLPYAKIRESILTEDGNVPRYHLFRWAEKATDEALQQAAGDLLTEDNDKRLVAYLRIFDRRAFPLDHSRLRHLAASGNSDIAYASCRALRNIQDQSIHLLAIDLMEKHGASDVVSLLVKNYVTGDEERIEAFLDKQVTDDDVHWAGHSALPVFEAHPEANAIHCMMKIYERSRCSICRMGAVKVLMQRRKIAGWTVEECRHDSNEAVREAAAQFAEKAE